MGWCWCSLRHVIPWRVLKTIASVVKSCIPFFMASPFTGSVNWPAVHISNWQVCECWWTLFIPGWIIIKDLAGCSQWKCRPFPTWCRYNTIPRAIWYLLECRNSWYLIWCSVDLLALSADHDDQGPQIGEYHMFMGLCRQIFSNSTERPEAVDRSPCCSPCRNACWSKFWTCWVSGEFSLQNTSPRTNGLPKDLVLCSICSSSVENWWINFLKSPTSWCVVTQLSAVTSAFRSNWSNRTSVVRLGFPSDEWPCPRHFPSAADGPAQLGTPDSRSEARSRPDARVSP